MGISTGILSFVTEAILYWAVNIDVPYIFDGALGVILTVAGAIAVFATVVMHFQGSSSRRTRQYDNYA